MDIFYNVPTVFVPLICIASRPSLNLSFSLVKSLVMCWCQIVYASTFVVKYEVYVSRWQSCFFDIQRPSSLLFLFSAREQPITSMNHQTAILVNLLLQSNVFTSLIRISVTFRSSVFISTETHSVINGFYACI